MSGRLKTDGKFSQEIVFAVCTNTEYNSMKVIAFMLSTHFRRKFPRTPEECDYVSSLYSSQWVRGS